MEAAAVGAAVEWSLRALAKAVAAMIERCIQVKENQAVFCRLSALLSCVVESLAGRRSTTETEDHAVRMFWSNTLPYVQAIIDQCTRSRKVLGLYNAKYRYKELEDAERSLLDFVKDMGIVLPSLYGDLLHRYPKEQDLSPRSDERAFRSDMTKTYASVKGILRGIGNARFTFFKAESSSSSSNSSTALKDIDLVFLCDATGGMANSDALDGVKSTIMQVIDDTRKNVDGTSGRLRLGLVAYRDLWNGHDLPEVEDLTFNAGRVKSHVRRLVSCGGMDIAEDVLGGLEAVAQLGWGPPSSRKVVVHFADAPCHGSKFHDLGPGGDALFDMKKCTAQYNGRTVGEALKMISTFRKIIKGASLLSEVKMDDPLVSEKIVDAVLWCPSVSSSANEQGPTLAPEQAVPQSPRTAPMQAVTPPIMAAPTQAAAPPPFIDPAPAVTPASPSRPSTLQTPSPLGEWSDIESEPEQCFQMYEIILKLNGVWNQCNMQAQTTLKVSKASVDGARWRRFRALLCDNGGGSADSNHMVLKKANHDPWASDYVSRLGRALYLAKTFSDPSATNNWPHKVEYAFKSFLKQVVGGKFNSYVLETSVAPPGHNPIETWATGGAFARPGTEMVLEAFVHFTDVHTRGNFLVADLQGGRRQVDGAYVLITPDVISRKGTMHDHEDAVEAFAACHKCNSICRVMKLDASSQGRVNSMRA